MKSLQNPEDYKRFMVDMPDDDNPDFIENTRIEVERAGYKIYNGHFVDGQGYENDDWLVVPNLKYHTKKNPWYTAYLKRPNVYEWDAEPSLALIRIKLKSYRWVKPADSEKKTSKFFWHIYWPDLN